MGLHTGLLALFLLAPVLLAVNAAWGPVSRARVNRFAQRQLLPITVENGPAVIGYLATTRRWRAGGLAGGYLLSALLSLRTGVGVNFLALFAGWFVGALVAEARVAHLAHGERRTASLTPRRIDNYLGRIARSFLPFSVVASVALAAVVGVAWLRGRPVEAAEAAWSLACGLAIYVVVRFMQRVVLRRPQPATTPDLLAADDAIRSRSLHALAGGGGTLVLYLALGALSALHSGLAQNSAGAQAVEVVMGLAIFVVPIVGYHISTSRWVVRRPEPTVGPPRIEATAP